MKLHQAGPVELLLADGLTPLAGAPRRTSSGGERYVFRSQATVDETPATILVETEPGPVDLEARRELVRESIDKVSSVEDLHESRSTWPGVGAAYDFRYVEHPLFLDTIDLRTLRRIAVDDRGRAVSVIVSGPPELWSRFALETTVDSLRGGEQS